VRRAVEPVAVGVVFSLGLIAALAIGAPAKLALQSWLLALGALGLLTATLALRAPVRPSALERALRRKAPAPERPLQLERIERELVLGAASAFDLHYRLRHTLREIAAQRLAEHHGVDLDAAGPDVLTAGTWALLRLDREVPRDRHAIGIPLARLDAVIAEIEAL